MKKRERTKKLMYETIPLSGGFMLTSMLGFVVVAVYTLYGRLDATWGFAFGMVFAIMFVASLVSITPIFPKELKKPN